MNHYIFKTCYLLFNVTLRLKFLFMRLKKLSAVLLLILSAYTLAAQTTTTITGKITDSRSVPVKDASVHLLNTNIAVFTDAQGDFTITNISAGGYIISFSAAGYATQN